MNLSQRDSWRYHYHYPINFYVCSISRIVSNDILETANSDVNSCFSKIDTNTSTSCDIYPLPHMYIVKDLIPDMNNFYNQYRSIQPWLQRDTAEKTGSQQYLQSIEDRKQLVSQLVYCLHICLILPFEHLSCRERSGVIYMFIACRMVSTSVFSALAAALLARPTGGTATST